MLAKFAAVQLLLHALLTPISTFRPARAVTGRILLCVRMSAEAVATPESSMTRSRIRINAKAITTVDPK